MYDIDYKYIKSPNYNPRGNNPIERLTVHCVVGEFPAATVAGWFADPNRRGSSNWVVGKDGDLVMCVDDINGRAWTSDNKYNDYHAITIECSSGLKDPYEFNPVVYESLINLVVNRMQLLEKKRLVYIPNKNDALNYKVKSDELLLTFHRWFAAVSCPGTWFINHASDFASRVNVALSGIEVTPPSNTTIYRVQVGAFKIKENAVRMRDKLTKDGYDAIIVKAN